MYGKLNLMVSLIHDVGEIRSGEMRIAPHDAKEETRNRFNLLN
jgi:hypothetical protein